MAIVDQFTQLMKMYHATTEEAWVEIQAEGILWGGKYRYWCGRKVPRANWLATTREYAEEWRSWQDLPVLLEVDMPDDDPDYWGDPDYQEDRWQHWVADAIPLRRVRRIWEDVV